MESRLLRAALGATAALLLGACGIEGLFNQYLGNQYTQPVSVIKGTVPWEGGRFTVVDAQGNEAEPYAFHSSGGQYEVQLIADSYANLKLRAILGEAVVETWVPKLDTEEVLEGVNIDTTTTAAVKIVEGLLGPAEKTVANLSDNLLCIMGKKISARAGQDPTARMIQMMDRINNRANKDVSGASNLTFTTPELAADYSVVTSPLNAGWLAGVFFDYTGDSVLDRSTTPFDLTYVEAVQSFDLSAPPDPSLLRVVFEVNFNAGQLDLACTQVNRFKWTRDEPGRQMFFVGGIHRTSPVQSTEIDAMLGNRGGWTPNQVKMYDDGTHGDRAAGDGIWSITFDLPRDTRIGYKYTWGKQGMLWTGTEEWPGNQRILKVEDRDSDGYMYRSDVFADEAANKDLANAYPGSGGTLDWDEDLNGDGYPEAGETPANTDADCGPDEFVTPEWVPALTIGCEQFVAE